MRCHCLRFGHLQLFVSLLLAISVRDAECLNARQRRAEAAKSKWVKGQSGPVELSVFERDLVTERITTGSILKVVACVG